MVKDNEISEKRAESGKMGGEKSLGKNRKIPPENSKETENFALNFAQAKTQANYGNGNGIENTGMEKSNKGGMGEKEKKGKAEKIQYAEFVSMTNAEYQALVTELGDEYAAKECVRILDNYKGSSGKRYKSDYRAILNWVIGRFHEEEKKKSSHGAGPITGDGRKHPSVAYGNNEKFDEERWNKAKMTSGV